MLSRQLLRLFHRAGLSSLADKIEYRRQFLRYYIKNRAFRTSHPDRALPPPYLLYEAFKLDYSNYYNGGLKTASWLISLLEPYLTFSGKRILDWGCGPARIIRHLPQLAGPDNEYHGCDSNSASIDWCIRNLPRIHFRQNQMSPPTAYSSGYFDLVYGISIFTHLSSENHSNWIDELLRIGRKNATYVITTHGDLFCEKLSAQEKHEYQSGNLVIRAEVREGHRSFAAFQPPRYMRRLLKNRAIIHAHIPGKKVDWGIEQDVWIFQKSDS